MRMESTSRNWSIAHRTPDQVFQFKPDRTSRGVPEGIVRLLAATETVGRAMSVVAQLVPEPEALVAGGLDGVVEAIV